MFSVFSGNQYSIVALAPDTLRTRRAEGLRPARPSAPAPDTLAVDSLLTRERAVVPDTAAADTLAARAGLLPPWTGPGIIDDALASPRAGLPDAEYAAVEPYRPRLQLDAIAPPAVGVAVGGGFGTRLGGSIGFYFSDMLGEHNLSLEALANGTLQDLGGQATYVNRAQRTNYGVQLAHIPILTRQGFTSIENGRLRFTEIEERIFATQLSVLGAYPLRTTRRLELQTGAARYGFDTNLRTFEQVPGGFVRVEDEDLASPDPLYVWQSSLAYVEDYSNFGFTSPVQGGRYRLQVGATIGRNDTFGLTRFVPVVADLRQYVRTGPVTFAGRVYHAGNYGADAGDLFSSEYLGYSFTQSYLRGYSFNSFEPEECLNTSSCASLNRLVGTRVALASAEIRVPLLGTEQFGLFSFPYLPTELTVFTDAGLAWTAEEPPVFKWARTSDERIPVVSVGTSARINLVGAVIFEVFYAYPFQRPEKGGFVGVNLLPGW
jgi:hypothetical protein